MQPAYLLKHALLLEARLQGVRFRTEPTETYDRTYAYGARIRKRLKRLFDVRTSSVRNSESNSGTEFGVEFEGKVWGDSFWRIPLGVQGTVGKFKSS